MTLLGMSAYLKPSKIIDCGRMHPRALISRPFFPYKTG